MPDLSSLWLTARLAFVTTVVLLLIGTPLAWWLAQTRSRFKPVIEAVIALPLVLPPTVLGFYLLIAMSPEAPFGGFWLQATGNTLSFSFMGLIIGSVIYSFPFMIQPLQNAFEGPVQKAMQTAASLRASKLDAFFTIAIPMSARGFVTAIVLSFAHTLGEFGVVLMVGGNIPDRTRVAAIEIYENVETLDYASAHSLSLILLIISFLTLFCVFLFNKRFPAHVRL